MKNDKKIFGINENLFWFRASYSVCLVGLFLGLIRTNGFEIALAYVMGIIVIILGNLTEQNIFKQKEEK